MSEIKTNKISPRKGTTQTIGDSGDTVSISCGATLSNAGTLTTAGISGGTINNSGGTLPSIRGVIEWDTTAKTSGFTAVSNKGYFCNTTSAAFTVTFPASPTAGDVIALKDYANTFDTNNLTIAPNGNKFDGGTGNGIISIEGANSQFIYVDSTRGWVLTDASKASDIAESATFISATGGTITTCGDYKIHTFTGPGTFCVSSTANPAGGPNNVDYLVTAGGAGGGTGGLRSGGGGGAGGHRTSFPSCGAGSLPMSVQGYPITVGSGGAGAIGDGKGTDGSNSVFSTITSAGGGAGGGQGSGPGNNGGSGGGGGDLGNGAAPGGTGNTPPVSPSQGNNGGSSSGFPATAGGGGGGIGGTGSNGSGPAGGAGGAGLSNSINGSATTRAGGGGGAHPSNPGSGGSGGGGVGGGPSGTPGGTGTTNSGSGGGGGNQNNAGSGGSGIVIIRYKYQ